MKLLIIDNNKHILSLYKNEFEDEGYEVITASTGEEALIKITTENPDIIIMEFLLPDVDGEMLSRKIKSKRPGTPLILSTAFYFQELFKSLSVDAYIMKSSNLTELIKEIMKYADVIRIKKTIAT
jgi:DNA-binding response OmpR family regulator